MKLRSNINDASDKALQGCTSCQVCATICPTTAITYFLDEDGFIRPSVSRDACINCGKCISVCYRYDDSLERKDFNELTRSHHYAARSDDSVNVLNATSGGVAGEITDTLLDQSYTCAGVTYDSSSRLALFSLALNKEDAERFKGSKYIQAQAGSTFKTIVDQCQDKQFAIFGLPCQIYAIDKILRKKKCRDKHVLIDLYCHGCPSINLWERYKDRTDKESTDREFSEMKFRTKYDAIWGQYRVGRYDSTGNPIYLGKISRDPFYDLFFSNQILNPSCNNCYLRGDLTHSDIRLGDFWGPKYILSQKGVSLVSINSAKGEEVFNGIKNRLELLDSAMPEDFADHQSLFCTYEVNADLRSRLLDSLRTTHDIEQTHQLLLNSYSTKKRLAEFAKTTLTILPYRVTQLAKYLYYHIK